jgi:hypothetical protein
MPSAVPAWNSLCPNAARPTKIPQGTASLELLGVCAFRTVTHLHYEVPDPETRLGNQGNRATARNPELGSPSHTCTARTSCRKAAPSARRRIAGRSPEPGLHHRNQCRGRSARRRVAGILMVITLAVDRRRGRRSSGVDLVKLNDRRATNAPCPSSHRLAANAAGYSRLMEADESDTLRRLRDPRCPDRQGWCCDGWSDLARCR